MKTKSNGGEFDRDLVENAVAHSVPELRELCDTLLLKSYRRPDYVSSSP